MDGIFDNHDYGLDPWGIHGKGAPTVLEEDQRAEVQQRCGNEIIYLQDSSCTLAGITFYGSPWNDCTQMAFGMHRADTDAKWRAIPNSTDVLVTHMPPRGVLDLAWDKSAPKGKCGLCGKTHPYYAHWGDNSLLHAVHERSIPLHCFGHVHDAAGVMQQKETTFSNASMDMRHTPNVIRISVSASRPTTIALPKYHPSAHVVHKSDKPPAPVSCHVVNAASGWVLSARQGSGMACCACAKSKGDAAQQWRFTGTTLSSCGATDKGQRLVLDVDAQSPTNVIGWVSRGTVNQQWVYDEKTRQLVNKLHNHVLGADHERVYMAPANASDKRQQWTIEPAADF
eukprot:NODE_2206_length_1114_cov_69.539007_g2188_i0.p1 GENE.NODE_2206_length_1114_cov_69.539007_g2188_i0~~NODE_2206_length_1114_cov_69.539007_g2188_i0.p1  ORF type:complete len:352 (-),score=70.00 NODE_2206_length_1114_cov_69.539007_g2188_i0:58-1077(-)